MSDRDFLVVVSLPYGGGSWARGKDREQTIQDCKRILKQDWKSLFKFKKGSKVLFNVLEVTGYNNVQWDDFGVRVDGKPFTGTIEKVNVEM